MKRRNFISHTVPMLLVLGTLAFLLKLSGVIRWDWLWITAPFWIIPVMILTLCLAVGITAAISVTIEERQRRKVLRAIKQNLASGKIS